MGFVAFGMNFVSVLMLSWCVIDEAKMMREN